MDTNELKYVYENGLIAFPSMATNFQYKSPLLLKAKLNMVMVVHGEQGITLHQPMPSNADVVLDTRVINCFDRGESKGAIIETETKVKLKKDDSPLCTLISKTFARGDGGFGGEDVPASTPIEIDSKPDIVHEQCQAYYLFQLEWKLEHLPHQNLHHLLQKFYLLMCTKESHLSLISLLFQSL